MLKHGKSALIGIALSTITLVPIVACGINNAKEKSFAQTKLKETIVKTDELLGIVTDFDLYYPITVVVTEIDWNSNMVTAVDRSGETWHFESKDAWIGDVYSCIVSDNAHGLVTVRFVGEISDYEN